jgi:uracil-DNA glycosylase
VAPKTDWNPLLSGEFTKPYWSELMRFVEAERSRYAVYPPAPDVFAALHLTPYSSVKAVILGQDPYHGKNQAHGLCFSVPHAVMPPPSLVNIHQELASDLGCSIPNHGSLESWARQGVLLLNTTLTVRGATPASHQRRGWETFTDEVIRVVNEKPERVVFILWGSSARAKKGLVDVSRHAIIQSPHPSPLSAHRGFFGSRPFSAANQALSQGGREPISWCIPPLAPRY